MELNNKHLSNYETKTLWIEKLYEYISECWYKNIKYILSSTQKDKHWSEKTIFFFIICNFKHIITIA